MTGFDPRYDVLSALQRYAPGVVLTREIEDGLVTAYADGGYAPLTEAQVLAVTGTLPSYPATLPRFDYSNPEPRRG